MSGTNIGGTTHSCATCSYRCSSMFCDLSAGALKELNEIGQMFSLSTGVTVINEGEPSGKVVLLCHGEMLLSCVSKEGRRLNLKIARQGELLGLSSMISNRPFELTAETMAPTQIKVIQRDAFLTMMSRHSDAAARAMQSLAASYNAAFSSARSLSLSTTVAGRIAQLFLDWGETGTMDGKKKHQFNMSVTHDDLADFTGTTRETVTRTLGKFQKDNLIRIHGVSVHILAPEKLSELVA